VQLLFQTAQSYTDNIAMVKAASDARSVRQFLPKLVHKIDIARPETRLVGS
jgi:hypothetical protein